MIIFNTTYHADHSRKDEFIDWLKNFYIPAVLEHGALQEPQLTRIFAENEEEGISLSLQFKSPDTDTLERWHASTPGPTSWATESCVSSVTPPN